MKTASKKSGQMFLSDAMQPELSRLFASFKLRFEDYIGYILNVIELQYGSGNRHRERLSTRKYLQYVISVYGLTGDEILIAEVAGKYEEYLAEYGQLLHGELEDVWENYLVYMYLSSLIPFGINDNVANSYTYLIAVYKLVEFLALAQLIANQGKLNEYDAYVLIVFIDSKFRHNVNDQSKLIGKIKAEKLSVADTMQLFLNG